MYELERELIYTELQELIPDLQRRRATPRVLAPIDKLLDQLILLNELDELHGTIEAEGL